MLNTRTASINTPTLSRREESHVSDVESKSDQVEIDLDVSQITALREILNWGQFANCKGKMKLFFAPKAERPQARHRREAKAQILCSACTVRESCQEFARENHEYGFWGGESEEQRHLAGFTVAAPIGIRARHPQLRQSVG